MRILIVDDDAAFLKVLLNAIHYDDVTCAYSGDDAVAVIVAAPEPFDCILLDHNIPPVAEIEVASQIRALQGYGPVPVVMLTAFSDTDHATQASGAGGSDYLAKPFDVLTLRTCMANLELRIFDQKRLPDTFVEGVRIGRETCGLASNDESFAADASGDKIVDGDGFGARLTNLTKQAPTSLGVLTMLIENFDDLSRKLNTEALDAYLAALARQLSDEFAKIQGIVSYQGEGVFMALSFAFDALGASPLKVVAERAAATTDIQVLGGIGLVTRLLVGRVLSRDLPDNVEPAYMLEVARGHLLHKDSVSP